MDDQSGFRPCTVSKLTTVPEDYICQLNATTVLSSVIKVIKLSEL